jgi:3-oxoacyl-[acyl-carrier protein] reductase
MQLDLTGRTAVVTGGNIGIGRGIALALAECGADVAVTYHQHGDSDTVVSIEALGRRAIALRMDACDSEDVNRVVAEVASVFGHVDILINNAGGLVARVGLGELTDQHWHRVIDLNLSSALYCARAVVPHMPAGGRIVNISSLAARNGGGVGTVAYVSAKAGLIGLTRALAKELAPQITVNAIAPGLVLETPFHETFTPIADQKSMINATLVKRAGLPVDIAGAVLFLVSDLSCFVTGVVLDVNGGADFA